MLIFLEIFTDVEWLRLHICMSLVFAEVDAFKMHFLSEIVYILCIYCLCLDLYCHAVYMLLHCATLGFMAFMKHSVTMLCNSG